MEQNIAIILCGGTGSRLWPLSTIHGPKQFRNFFGGKTLLENTIDRVPDKYSIVLVSNKIYEQYIDKFKDKYTIIYEKSKKNTAPSILSAILHIQNKYKTTNINFIVLPSDHYFDNDKFNQVIKEGHQYINHNIITFGIKPTYPEIGYGYIKFENSTIIEFIEKPSIEKATKLVNSGDYLWNSGVFMFNYQNIMDLYLEHNYNMAQICQYAINTAEINNNTIYYTVNDECPDVSFDCAIMENIKSGVIISYNGKWNDLGCWDRVYEFNQKDDNNNVIIGKGLTSNTKNCYIQSDSGIITTIGLDGIVIVKNDDEILISDMDNCNNVKLFSEHLEKYHLNKKNYRPWGYYEVILKETCVQVKKLIVYPRKRLSLQYHEHRSEHWVVSNGHGQAQVGYEIVDIKKNDHIYVKIGELHRIHNTSNNNLEIIETQIGDYLEEDDIVRIEDDYGRK